MASSSIEIKFNNLPGSTTQLHGILSGEVARAAHALEAQEKAKITEDDAVDTGFMRGSVQAQPDGDMTWVVGNGAEYSKYINYGTVKQAPRNFVESSVAIIEPQFFANVKSAVAKLGT